ncbi:MAG: acetyl-CoA hydrolase/transferase C-terminal domain-containing protein [Chloroflexota bacterium]
MKSWLSQYKNKIVSADEAVQIIQSNNRVFVTGNCSVPKELLSALIRRAPALENVEICHALTIGPLPDYLAPHLEGHLRVNTLFIGQSARKGVQEGRADFTPVLLSEFPLLFKNGILPVDVAFANLTPPDEHGFCSYGIETGLAKSPTESAKIIIAEMNDKMPRTMGDSFIHINRIKYVVPTSCMPFEASMSEEGDSDVVDKIGEYVAELIPDGATMQMGIGAIPDGVLKHLNTKKDLGIHTELFSNGVMDLVEKGVVTSARKTLHPGKIVVGFIIGNKRLYDWVNDNPLLELHPTEYINDPFIIAKNDRMVAINSAIEIDLTGQICADSIGPKLYSGVGGQLDFIYGASRSKDGVPVIALPSTTTIHTPDGGTKMISRIVALLKQGAGVVTTRNHVRYVVTEYGAVNLYGKSIRQRTHELISIAHPDFREEIYRQAKELHYL